MCRVLIWIFGSYFGFSGSIFGFSGLNLDFLEFVWYFFGSYFVCLFFWNFIRVLFCMFVMFNGFFSRLILYFGFLDIFRVAFWSFVFFIALFGNCVFCWLVLVLFWIFLFFFLFRFGSALEFSFLGICFRFVVWIFVFF